MSDVFASLERATLVETPFPHLVVEDALPASIADTLLAEMPPLDVFTRGRPAGINVRHALPSPEALADDRVSDAWKDALRACLAASQELLSRTVERLGDHILRTYPDFTSRFAPLDQLRAIPRSQTGRRSCDVGMDAQMVVNSPSLVGGTRVRGAHVDAPPKLISGLLYLRSRDDDSTGGELELYAPTVDRLIFDEGRVVAMNSVRFVRRYPYRHNLLVLPINSGVALHGVSPRGQTAKARYHLHLVGEMNAPLFEVRRSRPPMRRLKQKVLSLVGR